MRARVLVVTLLTLGCAAQHAPPRRPPPPPPPTDGIPSIVMRGDGTARDRRPPPEPDALPQPAPAPPSTRTPEWPRPQPGDPPWAGDLLDDDGHDDLAAASPEPAPDAGEQDLPVVLGDLAGLRVVTRARARDGTWSATIDVRNGTPHDWAGVDLELTLLDARRPLETVTFRSGELPRGGRQTLTVEGELLAGGDRLRLRVVEAEPMPGERDVAIRGDRLRNFVVRSARLLRTRTHELDAILDLAGGPFEHVPWATADFEVRFLDARGELITRGDAQLLRGAGPPWRLHVVGDAQSRRQVSLLELRCTNVH